MAAPRSVVATGVASPARSASVLITWSVCWPVTADTETERSVPSGERSMS